MPPKKKAVTQQQLNVDHFTLLKMQMELGLLFNPVTRYNHFQVPSS
jgi:hypothetical protein